MWPALPPLRALIETAETLAIALAGGLTFTLLGFPAGLVSGSVLAVAAAALLGRPVKVPLGAGVRLLRHRRHSARRRGDAGNVTASPPSRRASRFSCWLRWCMIARDHDLSARRASLGSAVGADGCKPGRRCQVIALSTELGGDLRAVAIVQTMRVLLLIIGMPGGLALFGLVAPAIPVARGPAGLVVVTGNVGRRRGVGRGRHCDGTDQISGRASVRRDGRIGHPARHRSRASRAAVVDRQRFGRGARRGGRFAFREHLAADARRLSRRGVRLVCRVDGGRHCRSC